MNRIEEEIKKRKKLFIAFITAGDPNLSVSEELVLEMERQGVDIVELGIPFSDPLADGPVIQRASERSLRQGTNLKKILSLVRHLRRKSQIPLVLMGYYNPIFRYGIERFFKDAAYIGVDGLIIPDLPLEEYKGEIDKYKISPNLYTIFLIAPTTPEKRMREIVLYSRGFVYYVSLTGTTGVRDKLANDIEDNVDRIKRYTSIPVCIGFGISQRMQVEDIFRFSDGVVVGSAIVKTIEENIGKGGLVKKVGRFVKGLIPK